MECLKCDYKWLSRVNIPLSCPRCKSRNWNERRYRNCKICNRNFLSIAIHHKDGNDKNNSNSNKINICIDCHTAIHNGLRTKNRIRKYSNQPEIAEKLNRLRKMVK